MSIQWGSSSVPCTLYLDGTKRCEMHLPTSLALSALSSEVSQQFSVTPHSWEYSVPGHAFREPLTDGDQFSRVLRGCAETKQMLQLNGLCLGGGGGGEVGRMVREYMEREGPRLLRDLAHQHRICCCNDRSAVDEDAIVTSSQTGITSSQAGIMSSQVPTPVSSSQPRRRQYTEEVGEASEERKRQKVTLGEREFLLACLESSHRVVPGQRMVARWNLIIRDTTSRWEVEEEGEGPLLRVGELEWRGVGDTIMTFSAAFLAPDREGTYESRWTLLRDGKSQGSFVFCKAVVSTTGPPNITANHGNISSDVATPKLLNNNKVFCVSRQQQWSHSGPNGVDVPGHSSSILAGNSSANIPGNSSANIPGNSSANIPGHSSTNIPPPGNSSTDRMICFANIDPGFAEDENNSNVYEAGIFLEDADPPVQAAGDGEVKMLNI